MTCGWLPELVEFDGDWNNFGDYVERVYEVFLEDFVRRCPPALYGVRISLRRHPEFQNKSASFWHLVTEGPVEDDRCPVVNRCERIAWPRAMLEHASLEKDLPLWRARRGSHERVLVALSDFSYVVVLDRRRGRDGKPYLLLLTAYPIETEHRRDKLRREHEAWKKTQTEAQKG